MTRDTKLGINDYWFVALIFLAALLGPIPFLGLIIYGAVAENSKVIKDGSKIAIILYAGVKIIQYVLDVVVYLVRCFDVSEYGLNGFYSFMNRVDYFIDGVFYGAILVFLVINVVKGLSVSSVSAQAVNPLLAAGIEKTEQEAAAKAAAPAAAPAQAEAPKKTPEVCPNCGKKLAEGVKFCAGCGTKIG
ncbi:MAG: zinc ribbon domain-containing protein [Lachnospiraceae bacterium]|nr:zinc ribbon domain-containing protein [Lachnospiraceae bacterium]